MRVIVALCVACLVCGIVLSQADGVKKPLLAGSRSHVLLIGVNQYDNVGAPLSNWEKQLYLTPLQYCARDMEGLRDALIKAKFCNPEDITLLTSDGTEPTLYAVAEALDSMCKRVKKGDRVLVAFAGHGVALVREGAIKDDYLCCSDANLRYNEIQQSFTTRLGVLRRIDVEKMLAETEATTRLFFVDACRNTPSESAASPGGRAVEGISVPMGEFGTGADLNITAKQGLFRFAGCLAEESSQEYGGDIRHGVFSYFLIKGLGGEADEDRNGIITFAELVDYTHVETQRFVIEKISSNCSQTPVLFHVPRELPPVLSKQIEVGYCKSQRLPVLVYQLASPASVRAVLAAGVLAVKWNKVDGAVGYSVEVATDEGFSQTVSQRASGANDTERLIHDLQPGVKYYVRVTAVGDGVSCNSSTSSPGVAATRDVKPLVAPQAVWARPAALGGAFTVLWAAVDNVARYEVEVAADKDFTQIEDKVMGRVGNTERTIYDLKPGETYFVRVRAIGDGVVFSDSSPSPVTSVVAKLPSPEPSELAAPTTTPMQVVTAVPTVEPTPVFQPASQPVVKLSAPRVSIPTRGSSMLAVEWDKVSGAAGYDLEITEDGTFSRDVKTLTFAANDTKCSIHGLQPGVTYYVRMTAVGDDATLFSRSSYSSVASASIETPPTKLIPFTPEPTPTAKLTTPKGVKAITATANGAIAVNWDHVADAKRYLVEVASDNKFEKLDGKSPRKQPVSANNTTIQHLTAGKTYYVRVRAEGDDKTLIASDYSAFSSARARDANANRSQFQYDPSPIPNYMGR